MAVTRNAAKTATRRAEATPSSMYSSPFVLELNERPAESASTAADQDVGGAPVVAVGLRRLRPEIEVIAQLLEIGLEELMQVVGRHPRARRPQVSRQQGCGDRHVIGPQQAQRGALAHEPPVGERGGEGGHASHRAGPRCAAQSRLPSAGGCCAVECLPSLCLATRAGVTPQAAYQR